MNGVQELREKTCFCVRPVYDVLNPTITTDSQSQAEAIQKENEKEETSEGNVRVVIFS